MTPNDPTLTHGSQEPDDSSEAEWNAGMAAAFGPAETASHHPAELEAGTILAGKYRLSERIGEGGMGSVWVAHQSEPVKRKVAVKLIKPGMDSRSVLARFEAERQALAVMDHPNIAKVLDGGLHDGRPFFVMELVKGVPITEYCDARKLTPKERLELFVPVCQAIQHAHQKGIIHRDIKPSNVLVALYDDKPVPKVIDFGIAKATGGTLTEHTIETAFGGVVGTPQYMSPEQASLNNLDIDTRSDVYSLGVLLYELLTGSPPFARKELEKKGILEILRVVREEEPPRPSTKLSTADALPSLSASRGTDPKKLTGLLRNELDWIVMKALEKDRARRYETANGFAADVQRYLAGEPVVAHPTSMGYRLKKFVRRNKGQVIAASLILFALLAGMVGTTLGLLEARRQTEIARDQEAEAKKQEAEAVKQAALAREEAAAKELARAEEARQRGVAEAEKKRADEEKQISQAVNDFLQKKLLAQADAKAQADALLQAGGLASDAKLNPTIRELLDRAAKELAPARIESSFPRQPLVQAEILLTVGKAYLGIGEPATAVEFFKRSSNLYRRHLGPDDRKTLLSVNQLANGYRSAGHLEQAMPLYEETYTRMKAVHGPDHPFTLIGMQNIASAYLDTGKVDAAVSLLEQSLARSEAKLGPDYLVTRIGGMESLALAYRDAGQHDRAIRLFEQTFDLQKENLGPDHPDTLQSMNNLAGGYRDAGQIAKAVTLFEETRALAEAKLGPDHPHTLTSMYNLAGCYGRAGQPNRALPLYEETLRRFTRKLGPDHPLTLQSMHGLAGGYRGAQQTDKAISLLEETIALRTAKLGPDHPSTLNSLNSLAWTYHESGRSDRARPMLEQVVARSKTALGPEHLTTFTHMHNLATVYWSLNLLDRSVPLFEELLTLREKKLGRGHPETLRSVANLGVNYKDAGRLPEAFPLLEEAYTASKKYASLSWVGPQLFVAYAKAGKAAEAAKLSGEVLADARKSLPPDSPQLAGQLAPFGLTLLELKAFADAEPILRECLAIREKTQPDSWSTFNTQSMLGGALLGQKKYTDAEPPLLKGYEGLKAREKTIPPQGSTRIPEALDRLIELYTATNKPDEAKKYQELRAKHPTPKEVAPMPREVKK